MLAAQRCAALPHIHQHIIACLFNCDYHNHMTPCQCCRLPAMYCQRCRCLYLMVLPKAAGSYPVAVTRHARQPVWQMLAAALNDDGVLISVLMPCLVGQNHAQSCVYHTMGVRCHQMVSTAACCALRFRLCSICNINCHLRHRESAQQ
jgi:hypothetical protein